MLSKKEILRYCLTLFFWAIFFFIGPIIQNKLLFCFSEEELVPLHKSYLLFGVLSLISMVVMEIFTFKQPDKVMVVYMVSFMMKFGMFVMFYIQLEGIPNEVLYSTAVPMLCFLFLQTIFIVVKLNKMNFKLKEK